MGKKSHSKVKSTPARSKTTIKYYPFVSICTPTFNRRPFIHNMFDIFHNQDYPKNRIEWIIVDDGTDSIEDLIQSSKINQIKYFRVQDKMSLGKKRNYMHSLISPKSEYVIYFDDDDWYPHDHISHAIESLENNPSFLIAGSSELYCYFKCTKAENGSVAKPSKLIQFGPYSQNHSTAGTFCFRRKLLSITKYDDSKELAEEKDFLQNYTIPIYQLNPLKSLLVFSHEHNTFDKRTLLENPNQFMKVSEKTVDAFFRADNPMDQKIKHFFMEEIDDLLNKYEDGEPKNKPNVLKQINEIKMKRNSEAQNTIPRQENNQKQIFIQNPGEEPRLLNQSQIIELIQMQQAKIEYLTQHIANLEEQCNMLQMKFV